MLRASPLLIGCLIALGVFPALLLVSGTYHIVVRARFGDYDAKWEAGITVKAGETFTIAEKPPGLFYRLVESR